jgi:hypothetical protein
MKRRILLCLHFSAERDCVEDQSQPSRTVQALRLVEDETAAVRRSVFCFEPAVKCKLGIPLPIGRD